MKLDNSTLFKYGFEVGVFGSNSIYNTSPYDVLMGIKYENISIYHYEFNKN